MSLAAFATRVSTCRVLAACLPDEFTVLDSPQDPITLLDAPNPTPLVAVYTGYGKTIHTARELLGGAPEIALTLQIFLPDRFEARFGAQSIAIDTRRQGADTALDIIWRIVVRGLLESETAWARIWRDVVLLTPETEQSSYLIEHASVRAIAREVTIKCETIHEPVPGGPVEGAWAALVAAMEADSGTDGLKDLANWVRAEIEGAPLEQGERDRIYLGISEYAAGVLTLAGPLPDAGDDPVIVP